MLIIPWKWQEQAPQVMRQLRLLGDPDNFVAVQIPEYRLPDAANSDKDPQLDIAINARALKDECYVMLVWCALTFSLTLLR